MPTKIRQGKYIDKDGIETDVVFLGAEKAIFDDNNVRLDNKLISMSKASGLTAEDTEGMLGTAEENVNFQLLIDAIAEKVMNELVTNSALTSQLANYVTKAMMSNSQTNDQNKVPTSALAYLMNQQITENENAITQLNGDLRNFAVITINISTENGYDEFNSQIASLLPNTKFIGNLRRKHGDIDNSNFIAGYKVNDSHAQAITTDQNTIKVLLVNNGITTYKEVQFASN